MAGLSVKGKVVPYVGGQRISQWGGKEIYLSKETSGPCLVIPKGKAKRVFPLRQPWPKVYGNFVADGKLTVEVEYMKKVTQLQIVTEDSIQELQELYRVLQTREEWKTLPRVTNDQKRKKGVGDASEGVIDRRDAALMFLQDNTTLSDEQLKVVRYIKAGVNVFFTGCAGTGKTYLIKEIIRCCDPATTFVVASTGIAAVEVGGITLHSFAGIGLGDGTLQQWIDKVSRSDRHSGYWRKCKLLIIDEISMVGAETFSKLDQLARTIRNRYTKPFGGIQLVVTGDFLQLPPVVKRGATDRDFTFQSPSWRELEFNVMPLLQVFRQTDARFLHALDCVRFGELTPEVLEVLNDATSTALDTSDGIVPTKVRALNKEVDEENERQLRALPGEETTIEAKDEGREGFLKSLTQNTQLPAILRLKAGAQVVLLKNLTPALTNGTRGIVVRITSAGLPLVRFTNGQEITVDRDSQTVALNRQVMASRTQVPLKLGWAVTVHKCQGMEIDRVEITLDKSVFEYGQAYTALSRCRSLDGLHITSFTPSCIRAHPAVIAFYKSHGIGPPTCPPAFEVVPPVAAGPPSGRRGDDIDDEEEKQSQEKGDAERHGTQETITDEPPVLRVAEDDDDDLFAVPQKSSPVVRGEAGHNSESTSVETSCGTTQLLDAPPETEGEPPHKQPRTEDA